MKQEHNHCGGMDAGKRSVGKSRPDELRDLARRLAKLPNEKKALFREALLRKGIDPWNLPMTSANHKLGDKRRLTLAQKRLWSVDQNQKEKKSYIITRDLQLEGKLNLSAVRWAFAEVLRRYECLRTVFVGSSIDDVYAMVKSGDTFEVNFVDLSEETPSFNSPDVQKVLKKSRDQYFDLSADVMLRVLVLRLHNACHILQVTMHHITADGGSVPILIGEFGALYNAFVLGEPSPFHEPVIQYADYSEWQHQWLQSKEFVSDLQFWQGALNNCPPRGSIPVDKPHPPSRSYNGNECASHISPASTARLVDFCQQRHATLFMGLFSIVSVLFARYSGKKDVLIGSPVANRDQADIGCQIGLLANLLVLRCDLSEAPGFDTVLKRNRDYLLKAYEYQRVPYESVNEALCSDAESLRQHLFQVVLVLQNNKMETNIGELIDLKCSFLEHKVPLAKYELRIQVSPHKGGLLVIWDYCTDLFHRSTIVQLAENFSRLLSAVLENPERNVFAISTSFTKTHDAIQYSAE